MTFICHYARFLSFLQKPFIKDGYGPFLPDNVGPWLKTVYKGYSKIINGSLGESVYNGYLLYKVMYKRPCIKGVTFIQ